MLHIVYTMQLMMHYPVLLNWFSYWTTQRLVYALWFCKTRWVNFSWIMLQHSSRWNMSVFHGPLTRYANLRVAHTPGMPGTFSPPPRLSDPYMRHGTCVTHVPRCMLGSLTSGFLWSGWQGKRSRHSRRMRNPQFSVSDKRPISDMPSILLRAQCSLMQAHHIPFSSVTAQSCVSSQWIWFALCCVWLWFITGRSIYPYPARLVQQLWWSTSEEYV